MLSVASEPVLNDELIETLWLDRPPVTGVKTANGLLGIVENAMAIMAVGWRKGKRRQVAQGAATGACATLQVFCFPLTSPTLGTPGACRRRARHAG
jgi:hypothetical protein